MAGCWRKKYLATKRKIDELEEHNEYLSEKLLKIQKQIVESEAEKEIITVRLAKHKQAEFINRDEDEPSHQTTPSPEHSTSPVLLGPPPLINMADT